MTTDAEGPEFAVVGGGEPTEEELAALAVALGEIAAARAEEAAEADDRRPPAWRRAALLEGVGGRAAVSAADLEALDADRRGASAPC